MATQRRERERRTRCAAQCRAGASGEQPRDHTATMSTDVQYDDDARPPAHLVVRWLRPPCGA